MENREEEDIMAKLRRIGHNGKLSRIGHNGKLRRVRPNVNWEE